MIPTILCMFLAVGVVWLINKGADAWLLRAEAMQTPSKRIESPAEREKALWRWHDVFDAHLIENDVEDYPGAYAAAERDRKAAQLEARRRGSLAMSNEPVITLGMATTEAVKAFYTGPAIYDPQHLANVEAMREDYRRKMQARYQAGPECGHAEHVIGCIGNCWARPLVAREAQLSSPERAMSPLLPRMRP